MSVRELTVYADLDDAALLRRVEQAARCVVGDAGDVRLVTRASLLAAAQDGHQQDSDRAQHTHTTTLTASTGSATAASRTLLFVRAWERDKADVTRAVTAAATAEAETRACNNGHSAQASSSLRPLLQRHECFVSDTLVARDGAVAYALYARQMPVLALADDTYGHDDDNDESDKAATAHAPVDALRALLYHTAHCCCGGGADDDKADDNTMTRMLAAIDGFFAHMTAATPGVRRDDTNSNNERCHAVGRVVSVDFVHALTAVDAVEAQRECEAVCALACAHYCARAAASSRCAHTQDSSGDNNDTVTRRGCVPRVALLAADGQMLQMWRDDGRGAVCTASLSHVLRPAARFDAVLRRLSACRQCDDDDDDKNNDSNDHNDDGDTVASWLQRSGHVSGGLVVLHRYEQRGLLRHLLVCGCRVVIVNHGVATLLPYVAAAAATTVQAQCVGQHEQQQQLCSNNTDNTTVTALHTLLRSLVQFERHWLDMPLPQHACLVRLPHRVDARSRAAADTAASDDNNNSDDDSDKRTAAAQLLLHCYAELTSPWHACDIGTAASTAKHAVAACTATHDTTPAARVRDDVVDGVALQPSCCHGTDALAACVSSWLEKVLQ